MRESRSAVLTAVVLTTIVLLPRPIVAQQHGTPAVVPAADSMSGAGPAPEMLSPAVIAAGRRVFHGAGACLGCHGVALEGGPIAPTLRAHRWRNGDGSYAMILHVIVEGVPSTVMVAHPGGISDEQARQVAAYVWAVSHGKVKP
ncbi:MAG TPA: c-type cytochrome [Gemmatimonadales bacterium]|nr:c-type cytochrome [Gemmatimonadales bacterium]